MGGAGVVLQPLTRPVDPLTPTFFRPEGAASPEDCARNGYSSPKALGS